MAGKLTIGTCPDCTDSFVVLTESGVCDECAGDNTDGKAPAEADGKVYQVVIYDVHGHSEVYEKGLTKEKAEEIASESPYYDVVRQRNRAG